ncbi:hypothetical protein OG259_10920 [Streptomyces sp. NBC_00250]|uniref:hypothetical protein n=1 Tax=Streptomyces sp. NBC_00250 TaxID=2903641 RepID=UPI002E2CA5D2|nr:hypothetical protein [Streptomyces sp. NBC_00250]
MHATLSTGTIETFTAPTLDGAERTGATEQTVSDVLSGRVAVRPATETRARARPRRTRPRPPASSDARSPPAVAHALGLIVPTVSPACHADVVEEAEDVLDAPSATRVLRTAPGVGSYEGHPQWELPMK